MGIKEIHIKEITREHILFDNGDEITYRTHFSKKYSEYYHILDFLSLPDEAKKFSYLEGQSLYPLTVITHIDWPEPKFGFRLPPYACNQSYQVLLYRVRNPYFDRTAAAESETLSQQTILRLQENGWDEHNEWVDARRCVTELLYNGEVVMQFTNRDGITLENRPLPFSEEPVCYDSKTSMKITEIMEDSIVFDNGKKITFEGEDDPGYMLNYADFLQMDDVGRNAVYYENELVFETVHGAGFRFGNRGGLMTFIPCYSYQNGCYSSDVNIFYDGSPVLFIGAYILE